MTTGARGGALGPVVHPGRSPPLVLLIAGALLVSCAAAPRDGRAAKPAFGAQAARPESFTIDGHRFLSLDFDRLAGFRPGTPLHRPGATQPKVPATAVADQIPAAIKKFDGQLVGIEGCLIPVTIDHGLGTTFLLVDPGFYAEAEDSPRVTEKVLVRMAAGVKFTMEKSVFCLGRFHLKGEFGPGGELVRLYELDGNTIFNDSGATLDPPPEAATGYTDLDFQWLAGFPYFAAVESPVGLQPGAGPAAGADQIPENVSALDGRKVVITGVMAKPGLTEGEYILYGPKAGFFLRKTMDVMPAINDYVLVQLPKGAKVPLGVPVACAGTLRVREHFDHGILNSIYQLEGETVTPAGRAGK